MKKESQKRLEYRLTPTRPSGERSPTRINVSALARTLKVTREHASRLLHGRSRLGIKVQKSMRRRFKMSADEVEAWFEELKVQHTTVGEKTTP